MNNSVGKLSDAPLIPFGRPATRPVGDFVGLLVPSILVGYSVGDGVSGVVAYCNEATVCLMGTVVQIEGNHFFLDSSNSLPV